jgi:hypothetical protein
MATSVGSQEGRQYGETWAWLTSLLRISFPNGNNSYNSLAYFNFKRT